MAAIAAAVRFVSKVVWVPMQVAGRMAMMPFTILEKVVGASSGGADATEEETAADQAAQQAKTTLATVEQASRSASKATDVRLLATYRAKGREIPPELWNRVRPEVEDYLRVLSSEECAQISAQDLKTVAAHMEGSTLIQGVRSTKEVGVASVHAPEQIPGRPNPFLQGATPEGLSAFQNQINAALEQARGKKEGAEHVMKA